MPGGGTGGPTVVARRASTWPVAALAVTTMSRAPTTEEFVNATTTVMPLLVVAVVPVGTA